MPFDYYQATLTPLIHNPFDPQGAAAGIKCTQGIACTRSRLNNAVAGVIIEQRRSRS